MGVCKSQRPGYGTSRCTDQVLIIIWCWTKEMIMMMMTRQRRSRGSIGWSLICGCIDFQSVHVQSNKRLVGHKMLSPPRFTLDGLICATCEGFAGGSFDGV